MAFSSAPRVALIGVSGYARLYYRILSDLFDRGAINLVAAVVIDSAKEEETIAALRARGCRIYLDYREMLAAHRGQLELCCVPTPIGWHARMTIDALLAGANVLVEKPLAVTLADVGAIIQAETAAGKFVAVAFQDVYLPAAHALRRAIVGGEIGRVEKINIGAVWPRNAAYYRRNGWAGQLYHDGTTVLDSPISNAFAHFLNLALFFANPAADTIGQIQRIATEFYRAQPIESFDTASMRIFTRTGVEINLCVTHSGETVFDPELTILGDGGWARWQYCGAVQMMTAAGKRHHQLLPGEVDLRRPMFDLVLRRLRDPAAPICTAAMAAAHARCVVLTHEASAIHDVPAAWIDGQLEAEDRRQLRIRGIEEAVREGCRQGKMFSELGCPWASPALVRLAD